MPILLDGNLLPNRDSLNLIRNSTYGSGINPMVSTQLAPIFCSRIDRQDLLRTRGPLQEQHMIAQGRKGLVHAWESSETLASKSGASTRSTWRTAAREVHDLNESSTVMDLGATLPVTGAESCSPSFQSVSFDLWCIGTLLTTCK